MKKESHLLLCFFSTMVFGCSPSLSTLSPEVTNTAIHLTSTPYFTPSPVPTNMAIPTPTIDPLIPLKTPKNGDNISLWGWKGYQVWASNTPLVSCRNGEVTDFVCGDNPQVNIYSWNSEQPWFFAGQAILDSQLVSTTFNFDQPYLNIVITANNSQKWAIDSIYGILDDSSEIPFGYAISKGNLAAVPLYWDTPNTPIDNLKYYIDLEKQRKTPAEVKDCGVVGKTPDSSVIIIRSGDGGGGTAILFRMLNSPTAWGNHRGEQAYRLVGVKIVAGVYSPQYSVCPN